MLLLLYEYNWDFPLRFCLMVNVSRPAPHWYMHMADWGFVLLLGDMTKTRECLNARTRLSFLTDEVNPLIANSTKWSNTPKQFIGCCWRIVWVCWTILWGWHLKGLIFVTSHMLINVFFASSPPLSLRIFSFHIWKYFLYNYLWWCHFQNPVDCLREWYVAWCNFYVYLDFRCTDCNTYSCCSIVLTSTPSPNLY